MYSQKYFEFFSISCLLIHALIVADDWHESLVRVTSPERLPGLTSSGISNNTSEDGDHEYYPAHNQTLHRHSNTALLRTTAPTAWNWRSATFYSGARGNGPHLTILRYYSSPMPNTHPRWPCTRLNQHSFRQFFFLKINTIQGPQIISNTFKARTPWDLLRRNVFNQSSHLL